MYHQHAPSRTVSGSIAPYTRQTVTPPAVSQRLCITSLHRGHVPSSSATSSTVDCQYCLLYSPLCGPPSQTNLPSPMPPGPLLFGAQAIKTPEVEIPCCHWPVVAHYHWQGSPSHGRFTPTSLHVSLYDGPSSMGSTALEPPPGPPGTWCKRTVVPLSHRSPDLCTGRAC